MTSQKNKNKTKQNKAKQKENLNAEMQKRKFDDAVPVYVPLRFHCVLFHLFLFFVLFCFVFLPYSHNSVNSVIGILSMMLNEGSIQI